jgi:hypothetical protein
MLNISPIVAGIVFVTLAAANVVVMLEASQPSRKGTTRSRLIAVHRAGGYLFVILLCIMAYSMSQRLAGSGITGHLPTHLVLHIVLVLVLVPLLLLKILIARRYKQSHSLLKALGIYMETRVNMFDAPSSLTKRLNGTRLLTAVYPSRDWHRI